MNKKIIIIAGVTGAIGSTLLSEYAQDANNVVYGISRKAMDLSAFIVNGKLPQKTLICNFNIDTDFKKFFQSINYTNVSEVIYIHALGLYPFEIDSAGSIKVENDKNGDGINDEVVHLSYDIFTNATKELQKAWNGETKCIIFGGIADVHKPAVHTSWWKTIEKVKDYMKSNSHNPQTRMCLVNISSVLCPHEIITRPFVFINTNATQEHWLHPYELAKFVVENVVKLKNTYTELEKFRVKPGFKAGSYYKDQEFTPRKVKELFIQ